MSYKDRKQLVEVLDNIIRGLHIQSTVFPEVPPMVEVSDRLTFGWGITENYTNLSISFYLFTRKRYKRHCSLIIDLLMLETGDLLYSFKAFKYGSNGEESGLVDATSINYTKDFNRSDIVEVVDSLTDEQVLAYLEGLQYMKFM